MGSLGSPRRRGCQGEKWDPLERGREKIGRKQDCVLQKRRRGSDASCMWIWNEARQHGEGKNCGTESDGAVSGSVSKLQERV